MKTIAQPEPQVQDSADRDFRRIAEIIRAVRLRLEAQETGK